MAKAKTNSSDAQSIAHSFILSIISRMASLDKSLSIRNSATELEFSCYLSATNCSCSIFCYLSLAAPVKTKNNKTPIYQEN